jgi:cysteinyl-tRNA synthetase
MIRFYNTLTRSLVPFEPLAPGQVGLYTCGPTVYDFAHIGNFRTFIWEDLLRRFLEARGLEVRHVMNITDVDDKIIARAVEKKADLRTVTAPYEDAFFQDLDTLNVLRAHVYPRATEHVPEMLGLIDRLKSQGLVYEREGSVYYRIAGFADYGRLSGKDPGELRAGASGRVDADSYDKDDVRDFALWKAARPGEPSWEGPAGPGRPGWHIECSAMSMKYLGDSFDIHTGGVDNIFPHHENEIAQSQGATGLPLARYWLHAAHLIVEGEKMSKSLGNFRTLRELLDEGHEPRTLRYFLLSSHYRRVLDLGAQSLATARQSLERLDDFVARLEEGRSAGKGDPRIKSGIAEATNRFHDCLDDDLNTAGALGALFEMVRDMNTSLDRQVAGSDEIGAALALLSDFETVFGIPLGREKEQLTAEEADLVQGREEARRNRDYAEADRIRDQLLERGIVLEDTPSGTRWKRGPGS